MSKPRGIAWLENETGQELDRDRPHEELVRHLSVRLPGSIVAQLEEVAEERGESVSQVARRFLADALARRSTPDRGALDDAIAALEALRSRLAHRPTFPDPFPDGPVPKGRAAGTPPVNGPVW